MTGTTKKKQNRKYRGQSICGKGKGSMNRQGCVETCVSACTLCVCVRVCVCICVCVRTQANRRCWHMSTRHMVWRKYSRPHRYIHLRRAQLVLCVCLFCVSASLSVISVLCVNVYLCRVSLFGCLCVLWACVLSLIALFCVHRSHPESSVSVVCISVLCACVYVISSVCLCVCESACSAVCAPVQSSVSAYRVEGSVSVSVCWLAVSLWSKGVCASLCPVRAVYLSVQQQK